MAKEVEGKLKLHPGDPGYVGRGHPPKHGQIKPKEARNPWGRAGKPKADAKVPDFSTSIAELLAMPVYSKDGRELTQDQLAHNALLKKMSEGDLGAIKYFHSLRERHHPKVHADGPSALDEVREELVAGAIKRQIARDAYLAENAAEATASDGQLAGEELQGADK